MSKEATANSSSEFFLQVKQDTGVFSNILLILEKIENENHMASLTSTFKSILEYEIAFAYGELRKIKQNYVNFDLTSQLLQNTLIYKENLKLICGSLSALNS